MEKKCRDVSCGLPRGHNLGCVRSHDTWDTWDIFKINRVFYGFERCLQKVILVHRHFIMPAFFIFFIP